MTYGPTSLTKRFAEIAAQEREWLEQGYCVGVLCKDETRWNAMGIFTAEDFEAEMALEAAKEERKAAYVYDEEAEAEWMAEMEREDAEIARVAVLTEAGPVTEFDRLLNHYQEGWA